MKYRERRSEVQWKIEVLKEEGAIITNNSTGQSSFDNLKSLHCNSGLGIMNFTLLLCVFDFENEHVSDLSSFPISS
jgi:hypothetical protein